MDERLRSLMVAAQKDISLLPLVAAEECRMGNHHWREHTGNRSPLSREKDSVDQVIDGIIKTQADPIKDRVDYHFSLCICFWCGTMQQRIFAYKWSGGTLIDRKFENSSFVCNSGKLSNNSGADELQQLK